MPLVNGSTADAPLENFMTFDDRKRCPITVNFSQPCSTVTPAHEMNTSLTVTVLPLAHPDVNDLLTVVFIGSQKFKPEYLPWQHASDPQIEGAAVSPLDETALGLSRRWLYPGVWGQCDS